VHNGHAISAWKGTRDVVSLQLQYPKAAILGKENELEIYQGVATNVKSVS